MKVFKAQPEYVGNNTLTQWLKVDGIIRENMTPEMSQAWDVLGYEGISPYACKLFGMSALYRDSDQCITFEFTDTQWTWFTMKWL